MNQQPNNPFAAPTAAKPFSFGQPAQQPALGSTTQPLSSNTTSSFSFGQPANTQQQTSNPFGAPAQNTAQSIFGKPPEQQTSSVFGAAPQPAGTSLFGKGPSTAPSPFGQPQQPTTGGLFGSSGSTGFGQANTAGFGQRPGAQFTFGQPTSTTHPGSGLFGGGAQLGTAQQQAPFISDSSRQHVCVHKDTLEKLKAVDWSKISDKTPYHELPEQVKTLLIDISRRQEAEDIAREAAEQNLVDVKAMQSKITDLASEEAIAQPAEDGKPLLSTALSKTVDTLQQKSTENLAAADGLIAKATKLQSTIQQSLRGLFDFVRTKKELRSEVRAEIENAPIFQVLTAEVEEKMLSILTLLPSLAIRWNLLEPRTAAVAARKAVQGLQDMLYTLSARLRGGQDNAKPTQALFARV